MVLESVYKNKDFTQKYLLLTIILSAAALGFNFLGILNIPAIQVISSILIIAAFIDLFVLSLILYEVVNTQDAFGKKIKLLNHLLLMVLAIAPLLSSLGGMLSSFMLYFIGPNTQDLSMLSLTTSILALSLTTGLGICISLLCYLKIDESNMWKF